MSRGVPYRDDADAARERIEELERDGARRRVELDLARRRDAELALLRQQLARVRSERDALAQTGAWSPLVRRIVIGALVSSWFALVAATAGSMAFRSRASAASARARRARDDLSALAAELDRVRDDLATAMLPIGPSVPTNTPSAGTPFGTVIRARVVRADHSTWAQPGETCVLAVAHGAAWTPCRATLHCFDRQLWSPDLACDVGLVMMPPDLLRIRSQGTRRPSIHFDRATRRLEIGDSTTEPAVVLDVLAITPFALP